MPETQDPDQIVRNQLIWLLEEGHAHVPFAKAIADFPTELRGTRPEGGSHSAWEQIEHMRRALNDILLFSRSAGHVSPKFPEGYWPDGPEPPSERAWEETLAAFDKDMAAFADLIRDPARDLHEPFPWGDGQTLMREALVIADHNAYHTGQIVLIRRLLGAWG